MARTFPDDLDRRIIDELRRDARLSYRAIARALGKSPPVIAERIKRMEQVGLIRGYHVETALDPGSGAARIPALVCSECKDPILGPARTNKVGGHSRVFCCKVCQNNFTERFSRATTKSRNALTAWTLVATTLLTAGMGASCLANPGCASMPTPSMWHPSCLPGSTAQRFDGPSHLARFRAGPWTPPTRRMGLRVSLTTVKSAPFIRPAR